MFAYNLNKDLIRLSEFFIDQRALSVVAAIICEGNLDLVEPDIVILLGIDPNLDSFWRGTNGMSHEIFPVLLGWGDRKVYTGRVGGGFSRVHEIRISYLKNHSFWELSIGVWWGIVSLWPLNVNQVQRKSRLAVNKHLPVIVLDQVVKSYSVFSCMGLITGHYLDWKRLSFVAVAELKFEWKLISDKSLIQWNYSCRNCVVTITLWRLLIALLPFEFRFAWLNYIGYVIKCTLVHRHHPTVEAESVVESVNRPFVSSPAVFSVDSDFVVTSHGDPRLLEIGDSGVLEHSKYAKLRRMLSNKVSGRCQNGFVKASPLSLVRFFIKFLDVHGIVLGPDTAVSVGVAQIARIVKSRPQRDREKTCFLINNVHEKVSVKSCLRWPGHEVIIRLVARVLVVIQSEWKLLGVQAWKVAGYSHCHISNILKGVVIKVELNSLAISPPRISDIWNCWILVFGYNSAIVHDSLPSEPPEIIWIAGGTAPLVTPSCIDFERGTWGDKFSRPIPEDVVLQPWVSINLRVLRIWIKLFLCAIPHCCIWLKNLMTILAVQRAPLLVNHHFIKIVRVVVTIAWSPLPRVNQGI